MELNTKEVVCDCENGPIIGIGPIKKEGKASKTTVNLVYLEAAINIAKNLSWREVIVCVGKDMPIVLKRYKEDKKGIMIAPIINAPIIDIER